MNEEKLALKGQKSNKNAQSKGAKAQDKKKDAIVTIEPSETQSVLECSPNPNVVISNPDRAVHQTPGAKR